MTTKFQSLVTTLQRQGDVKRRSAQPKRFRLKVQLLISNSLFSFLFANIRIFISLVSSPFVFFFRRFPLHTVYQFSLKRLCVDFVVAWNHSTLHSLSLSPLISYSRLFYPLVRLILSYLPLLLSFVLRLVLYPSHMTLLTYIHTNTSHVRTRMHTLTRMWTCNNQNFKKVVGNFWFEFRVKVDINKKCRSHLNVSFIMLLSKARDFLIWNSLWR